MSAYQIIVGTGPTPKAAAADAESQVPSGWQQIGISSCVLPGSSGVSPTEQAILAELENLAANIYQLVQCSCPKLIGEKIKAPGTPPPVIIGPIGPVGSGAGQPLWVVYLLLQQ